MKTLYCVFDLLCDPQGMIDRSKPDFKTKKPSSAKNVRGLFGSSNLDHQFSGLKVGFDVRFLVDVV